jgi:hypothetical protein
MNIADLTDRKINGIEPTDELIEVVPSDNGEGDEYDVYRDGKHIGCLYDDSGYKFAPDAFAGD